jgi:hypothetical protein
MNPRTTRPRGAVFSEREAPDHPEQSNRATVPIPLRRLAASQTTRPKNAGRSGLRRGMGTVG